MADLGVGDPKYKLDYNKIEKDAGAGAKPRQKALWEYPLDAVHAATNATVEGAKAVGRGVGRAYDWATTPAPPPVAPVIIPKSPTDGVVNRPMVDIDGKPSSTNKEIEKILKGK